MSHRNELESHEHSVRARIESNEDVEVNMCCTYVVDEHRCNTVESRAFFRRNHASTLSAADSAAPSFFIFLSAAM